MKTLGVYAIELLLQIDIIKCYTLYSYRKFIPGI